MPHLVVTIAAAAASAGIAASGVAIGVKLALTVALTAVTGVVNRALTPDIDRSITATHTTNNANESLKFRFGEFWSAGHVAYHTSTHNELVMHVCDVYAPHESEKFIMMQLGEQYIHFDTMLDAQGFPEEGLYIQSSSPVNRPWLRLEWELGSGTYTNWPTPVTGQNYHTHYERFNTVPDEWANVTAHGSGATKLWGRYMGSVDRFPNGLRDRRIFARWNNQIYDPRDLTTKYTNNPALCLRWYLLRAKDEYGAGWTSAQLDEDSFTTAANVCDQEVEVDNGWTIDVTSADTSTDELLCRKLDSAGKNYPRLMAQTGDGVELTNGGTLPTGLSASPTRYYVIVTQMQAGWEGMEDETWRIQLATTYANALAGTAIDITGAGSGTHTLTLHSQPRYVFAGSVDTADRPEDNIKLFLNAMGATLTPINGKAYLQTAAWVAPTLSYNQNNMRGPLEFLQTRDPSESRFNAIKGQFMDQSKFGSGSTYEPVTNSTYETNDGGSRQYKDQNFPGVPREGQARRLAKIHLEKARQEIMVKIPFKRGARSGDVPMELQKGDNFDFTHTVAGWTDKEFECIDYSFVFNQGDGAGRAIGIDVIARETASTVYDWASGDETTEDPAPNTGLPTGDPLEPTNLRVVESRLDNATQYVIEALFEWDAPVDFEVNRAGHYYEARFRASTDSSATAWREMGENIQNEYAKATDIEPDTYRWQVRAVDDIGRTSDWVTLDKEIFGFNDPPGAPTNWNGVLIGDQVMAWKNLSTEDDVLYGGTLLIRHDSDPVTTSADWNDATSIGNDKGEYAAGNATAIMLPARTGHYCAKYRDRFDQLSTSFSSFHIIQSTTGYTSAATVTEHSTFTGTKTNCNVSGGALTMDTSGGTSVVSSATYEFANAMNLTAVTRVRVTPNIDVNIFFEYSNFDSRTDNMDDWLSFDDTDGSAAEARVWFRITEDDPTGSPTWSGWSILDVAVVDAWGIEFKVEMKSFDSQTNIDILELSCEAETLP